MLNFLEVVFLNRGRASFYQEVLQSPNRDLGQESCGKALPQSLEGLLELWRPRGPLTLPGVLRS